MQTEFRAIVHSEYGAPEKVLKIAQRQLNSEELGADDVLADFQKAIEHVSSPRKTGMVLLKSPI
jgi:hypothetical protein